LAVFACVPTIFPSTTPTNAREILQTTDKIIRRFPHVRHVFGKVGRTESAIDPAPFDLIETTIMLTGVSSPSMALMLFWAHWPITRS
jgi:copper/silver efflux system protein